MKIYLKNGNVITFKKDIFCELTVIIDQDFHYKGTISEISLLNRDNLFEIHVQGKNINESGVIIEYSEGLENRVLSKVVELLTFTGNMVEPDYISHIIIQGQLTA